MRYQDKIFFRIRKLDDEWGCIGGAFAVEYTLDIGRSWYRKRICESYDRALYWLQNDCSYCGGEIWKGGKLWIVRVRAKELLDAVKMTKI